MIKPLLLAAGSLFAMPVIAQPSLSVNGTTSFTILTGTPVSIDGLVLTPAANFSIAAPNQLYRNTAFSHAAQGTHLLRVYKWNNTLSSFQGQVTLYYEDAELNGLPELSLILQLHNGTTWTPFTTVVSRDATANDVVTNINNYAIDELTLTDQATILPLVWGSIRAYRAQEKAFIQWEAYDMEAGSYFSIERSVEGEQWQPIGEPVEANEHNNHYTVADNKAPEVKTYYRIRLLRQNGQAGEWSRITSVPPLEHAQASAYPNPITGRLVLQSPSSPIQQVKVYNMAGHLVYTAMPVNAALHVCPAANWLPGRYLAQLVLANKTTVSFSIIKQ